MVLLLVFMQLTRDLFAIAKFLLGTVVLYKGTTVFKLKHIPFKLSSQKLCSDTIHKLFMF